MNNPNQSLSSDEQFYMPFVNYRALKNIESAHQKVKYILSSLKLMPPRPILDNLNDRTRFSYFEPVTSTKNVKYFIKIKLFEDKYINNYFYKNKVLGDALRNNPLQKLNHYTPSLIEGTQDYLLYKYAQGNNYGNRYYYQPSFIVMNDLPKLFQIINAVNEFPISLLPKNYEVHGWPYMMFHIYKEGEITQREIEYKELFTSREYSFISSLFYNKKLEQIVKTNSYNLSHNDFQPTNFINRDTFIQIVDWDNSGIDHKFYDLVKFYIVHYRKRKIQKVIFDFALQNVAKTKEDKVIFFASLIARSMVECTALMKEEKINLLNHHKTMILKQEILKTRIMDTKYWIAQLSTLLQ